jgi:hypothetical protein
MFKKALSACVLILFFLASQAVAHQLIIGVMDNGDDTITIKGKFDTGASAEGALVRLESLYSGAVLYEQRLPQESEITLKIPDEPYRIVLDGGPGHVREKDGIPPQKGYLVKAEKMRKATGPKKDRLNMPFAVSIGTAFFLLLLTIFISIYNTKKIVKAISEESMQ